MGKRALIVRYGAYGDIVHCSHLPRLLKDQGFTTVDFETNIKGYQLLGDNPFIDNLSCFADCDQINLPEWWVEKRWAVMASEYDKFINLYRTLESNVSLLEDQSEYYMNSAVRRARYDDVNYYDVTTKAAGYPELCGKYKGELFFPESEHDVVKTWMKKFEGKFVVMMNVCGTGAHKEMVQRKEIVDHFLEFYPDAHIIFTGGQEHAKLDVRSDNATSIIGKFPFRQAALIAKYVNLVMTLESGIGCVASMWGTPTIQMMTAASITSHCKYAENDLSVQSPAYCSPCHKGPYQYIGCPNIDGKPLCVYFDLDKVFHQIKKAYDIYKQNH